MNDFIHADIFFVVTTVAVVVVALAFTIALIYLILILRRVRDIAEQVREETILFREDVHELRDQVKKTGLGAKSAIAAFKLFKNLFDRRNSKKSK